MVAPDYWRQLDLVTPDELRQPVTVVGAGGIGSPTTLALAKMGCSRLTVYDPDVVEAHNLPNQLYRLEDVDRPKVEALSAIVQAFTGVELTARRERVEAQRLRGLVVSGVDSMDARRRIWQGAIRYQAGVPFYVDARMGAEVARVYSTRPTDPDDVAAYEATLYDDDEATPDACTRQAIVYNVLAIAGLVANQVKKHVKGERVERELIFDLATLTLLAG
jgi:molybdopterin/thiamine biosynthesis adenylyltransferase